MDMKINYKYVRELRTKANWSQEDLAAASGLSLRTIQRVENDGTSSLDTRRALAAAFGLVPNDLDLMNPANDPSARIGTGMLAFWIGIAWLFNLGLGIGLLGVGAVYLVGQVGRITIDKKPIMWELVATGVVFFIAGLATLIGLEIQIPAVLLVVIGCMMMLSGHKK